MSEPVAFVSHFRVKEGRLEELKRLSAEATERLASEKPRTLVFISFLDEERATVSFLHVFADAESMDVHFEGAAERARTSYELMDPAGWELYGTPSEAALTALRTAAASAGVELTVEPRFLAGFLRVADGRPPRP